MKLIFDLTKTQPIGAIKFHGGGRYGEIVFKSLTKRSKDIIAYFDSNRWINPEVVAICQENNLLMLDASTRSLQDVVKEYNGVVYSPIIEGNLDVIGDDIEYITTVHGLRALELPYDKYMGNYQSRNFSYLYQLYYKWKAKKDFESTLKRYRQVFKKKNLHVITVSEHSKASILSFIPYLKQQDIQVFYSPSTINPSYEDIQPYSCEEDKYYLMVSCDRWTKNTIRAVIAFDEIFSERPGFKGKVILTGVTNEQVFDKYIKNKSRFIFKGYVEEETLASLYKGAYLFVYPSLNEGFGYPPIEAMTQGTPIIASAISSIPEICRDSVLYFNPFIISEIKMRILQMENHELRDEYIERQFSIVQEVTKKQNLDLERLTQHILSYVPISIVQ